jgi:hypothetical protein
MFGVSLVALSACTWTGAEVLGRYAARGHEAQEDFRTVLAACLTLLGLIIGFSFSMAISRYDLRKGYEAAEASAISTEFVRADFLAPADADRTRQLLKAYLAQRISFFSLRDARSLEVLGEQTRNMQGQLWSIVRAGATAQPNPIIALVVSGMNDVLDSEGNTQAAWWNRIPTAAWVLMALIAILCTSMGGFAARHLRGRSSLYVLPLAISTAFFLIADIDSPGGGGVIHIVPHDLLSLAQTLP